MIVAAESGVPYPTSLPLPCLPLRLETGDVEVRLAEGSAEYLSRCWYPEGELLCCTAAEDMFLHSHPLLCPSLSYAKRFICLPG